MRVIPDLPKRLHIGLILENGLVPAWTCRVIDDILSSDRFEISLVATISDFQSSTVAFRLFKGWDEQIGRLRNGYRHHSLSRRALPVLPSDCHLMQVTTAGLKHKSQGDFVAIKAFQLDLLICFGSEQLASSLASAAQYGVWYYTPNFSSLTGLAATFWQLQSGKHCLTARLMAINGEGQAPNVRFETVGGLGPQLMSLGSQSACWKLAQATLLQLHAFWQNGRVSCLESHHLIESKTQDKLPSAYALVQQALRQASSVFESLRKRDDWHIAIRHKTRDQAGVSKLLSNDEYILIENPEGRFLADPFMVEEDNSLYVFVEDYDACSGKAVISCLTRCDDGNFTAPVPVLECAYHLSYPFLFKHDGQWYMMPETSGNRTIEIYRATSFPYKWELDRVLMKDICATDATLLQHDNRWWLFANVLPQHSSPADLNINDELYLYYADDLSGPWQAHPMNPIVSNVQQARCAGSIFEHKKMLIRPAQDCSKTYGHAVSFCRIDELSTSDYRQTVIAKLLPSRGNYIGLHTFNQTTHFEVIDLKSRYSRFSMQFYKHDHSNRAQQGTYMPSIIYDSSFASNIITSKCEVEAHIQ